MGERDVMGKASERVSRGIVESPRKSETFTVYIHPIAVVKHKIDIVAEF
jgi:hypothetical protein